MKPAASMSLHLFFRILGIALLLTLAWQLSPCLLATLSEILLATGR